MKLKKIKKNKKSNKHENIRPLLDLSNESLNLISVV